jgi:hypothetical protein
MSKNEKKKHYHVQCTFYYSLITTYSYPCFKGYIIFNTALFTCCCVFFGKHIHKNQDLWPLPFLTLLLTPPNGAIAHCISQDSVSLIVFLKTVYHSLYFSRQSWLTLAQGNCAHMLQCSQVMQSAILQHLNIPWNTSLYGSRKTVSSIKLVGVSKPLVCFLSRIRFSWWLSYSRSSVLQLYCEANGKHFIFLTKCGTAELQGLA